MNLFQDMDGVDTVGILLVVAVLVLITTLSWATYVYYTSNKIKLIANDWHCTVYKTEASSIIVGKTIVPTSTQVCITYEMNK